MIDCNVKKKLKEFILNSSIKDEGTIAITGENGSGKSTLAKVINGSLKQDEGYVSVNGKDVTRKRVGERGVILVTPNSYISSFSASKHLRWGYKVGSKRGNLIDIEEAVQDLKVPVGDKKLEELSLGNKERVSLATALLGKPEVLIVDEAFSNINDRDHFIQNFISLSKKNSIQVLYITQEINDVRYADHHYIMKNGTLEKDY